MEKVIGLLVLLYEVFSPWRVQQIDNVLCFEIMTDGFVATTNVLWLMYSKLQMQVILGVVY